MPQSVPQQKPGIAPPAAFESSPGIARERVVEEPRRPPEPPLRLANEEHVIDELLDAESILRGR